MSRRDIPGWALAAAAAYALYFHGITARGLIGPDEPRYAAIASEMARSGDWVTPRLWGEPWFEKPALLYWLGAAAETLGVDRELATRVPVALISALFLVYFFLRCRRAFGPRQAAYASAVLATSGGWVAFSNAGVVDLLLSAAVGAALLALLDWVDDPRQAPRLRWFGALLAVGTLAKGLAAPAIAGLALLAFNWRIVIPNKRRLGPLISVSWPFLLVAGPWYALCFAVNGKVFFDEFIWRHHVLRLVSPELEHVQPFWFYLPVLAGALLPWTPLLAALRHRDLFLDPKARFLAGWALTTLFFFSIATNKLPGYILPALPPLAALIGLALDRRRAGAGLLALSGLCLAALPLTARVLPQAMAHGLRSAWPPEGGFVLPAALAVAFAAGLFAAGRAGRLALGVGLLAGATTLGYIYLKQQVFPALDQAAGARQVWHQAAPQASQTCLGDDLRRHIAYGLAFYNGAELPLCSELPLPYRIVSDPPRRVSP